MRTRGDWRFVALFALAALLFGLAAPVRAATVDVGMHAHLLVANHPRDGVVIPKAKRSFTVTPRLHDMTDGKVRYLRVDATSPGGSQREVYKRSFTLGPCADCAAAPFTVTIDFSALPTGRTELRWHLDVLRTNGKRLFTTSRSQVCNGACSPSYRASNLINGAGAWYTDTSYTTGFLRSSEGLLKPGGSVTWDIDQGDRACVFANPNFHDGSHGQRLGDCWTTTSAVTRAIPATLAAGDKLALFVSEKGKAATILVETLHSGTAGPTATYEFQAWWDDIAIVLP